MKVGDKVRYVNLAWAVCHTRNGIIKLPNISFYKLGDIDEITELLPTYEHYAASVTMKYGSCGLATKSDAFPFVRIGEWGYAPVACFELVEAAALPPTKLKCTCPDINFYFNGIGCKCGGC
jgi:hypothetical protein